MSRTEDDPLLTELKLLRAGVNKTYREARIMKRQVARAIEMAEAEQTTAEEAHDEQERNTQDPRT